MSGKYTMHGSFADRDKAVNRQALKAGATIKRVAIHGKIRWLVFTPPDKKHS